MSWLRTEPAGVADELQKIHIQLRALRLQLEDQADRAPYTFITERLQKLGANEERSSLAVAARLAALGRHADETDADTLVDGRNCWERLVRLQDGYRDLIRQLKPLSVRWEDEHPEDAQLLASVRDTAVASRTIVGDLVARSDPHALD
ncbi:MAG: hypothetical protein P8R42_22785 [Candidatus Binatia bacterium]|nr:hypothetical protein [Candidatus Binatia bacterium]